jgi:predicted RNA binding protein YcfA (HicA-like mRNA interferase family)
MLPRRKLLSNRLIPVSRRNLIKRLKELGFVGPYTGPDHAFMVRGITRVRIPNPHKKEIGLDLLLEILREGGISRDEWLSN